MCLVSLREIKMLQLCENIEQIHALNFALKTYITLFPRLVSKYFMSYFRFILVPFLGESLK